MFDDWFIDNVVEQVKNDMYADDGPLPQMPTQSELDNAANNFYDQALAFAVSTSFLDAALMAPHKIKEAIPEEASYTIVWDSGASVCLTNDIKDFPDGIESVSGMQKLGGLAKGIQIKGVGMAEWTVLDTSGGMRTLRLKTFAQLLDGFVMFLLLVVQRRKLHARCFQTSHVWVNGR